MTDIQSSWKLTCALRQVAPEHEADAKVIYTTAEENNILPRVFPHEECKSYF